MIRSKTSRRDFLEAIGGVGAVAAGTLATLESARGYAANDILYGGLPGHRRPLPDADEVAGPGAGGPDRGRLRHLRRAPRRGEEAGGSQGRRDQALSRAPRPQGHRRRPDRQPRPLARADGRRCLQRRQGRLCREAADPRPGRGRGDHRRPESEPEDRPGRHAAAEHAPHPEGARAGQGWADRRDLQGPPDLEPRRDRRVSSGRRWASTPPGRLERLPRPCPRPVVRRVPLPQLALVLGFRRRTPHRPDGPLDRRRPLVPRRRPSAQGHDDRQPLRQQGRLADARHDPVHPGIPEQRPGPLRRDVLQRELTAP